MKEGNGKKEKAKVSEDLVMQEVLEEKKAVLFAKVAELIEDKSKVGEIQKTINSTIDSVFNLGTIDSGFIEKGTEAISNLGNFFNNYLNPANSKYKQLYDNQRLVIDCLLQALRIQQVQITINEQGHNPITDILSLVGSAASISKTDPDDKPAVEETDKE